MRDGLVGAAVYLTLIAVQEGRHALTARALGGLELTRFGGHLILGISPEEGVLMGRPSK